MIEYVHWLLCHYSEDSELYVLAGVLTLEVLVIVVIHNGDTLLAELSVFCNINILFYNAKSHRFYCNCISSEELIF